MTSASTKRRHKRNAELVAAWRHPIGTPVLVERDNGSTLETVTESDAFLLDGVHAMIRVLGIHGNTRLSRVAHLLDVERAPKPRRIKVAAPIVALKDGGQSIELHIGGRAFTLMTPDNHASRSLAVALHMAKSVTLEIDEDSRFTAPEDKT